MIRVSHHALEQYKRRVGRKTGDPEQEIIELYNDAEEESERNPGLIKRKLKYMDDARYYKNGRWRLVVIDHTVVTVEKDSFDYTGLGCYKHDSKRRSKKAWKWKNPQKDEDEQFPI